MSFLNLHLSIASLLRRIFSLRFLKFGIVGSSGIVVNQGVLYVMLSYASHLPHAANGGYTISDFLSQAVAIFFATLNNFFWNRRWTWADRKHHYGRPWLTQFGEYALACWLSIALQFLLFYLLKPHFYYLLANLFAIALTSVLNFVLNDIWTFGRMKLLGAAAGKTHHDDLA